MKNKLKVILWDFDGVILNSNKIRDLGFMKVLENYPKEQVNKLMDFHRINGGLSRYVKFRYFFEEVRGEKITDNEIKSLASSFSEIMMELLRDESLIIEETVSFIKSNYEKYKMHIVSGSDGDELKLLCKSLNIDKYFISINGSPTPKNMLVKDLIETYNYNKENCLLIGDSINDFDAAEINNISFLGYGRDENVLNKSNVSNILI